jgi:hypothetical protein
MYQNHLDYAQGLSRMTLSRLLYLPWLSEFCQFPGERRHNQPLFQLHACKRQERHPEGLTHGMYRQGYTTTHLNRDLFLSQPEKHLWLPQNAFP